MVSTDTPTFPDWLTVGSDVVLFRSIGHSRRYHIVETKVERFTKTLVVLENGERFPLSLTRRGGSSWDPSTYLKSPDDPDVIRGRLYNQKASFETKASRAYDAWRRNMSRDNAIEVESRFRQLREFLLKHEQDLT